MTTLLAGPWCGEFGWELMTWIPYCRYISRDYDQTVVVCQPGHESLYKDFAERCIPWKFRGGSGGDNWFFSRFPTVAPYMPPEIEELYPEAVVKVPNRVRCCLTPKRRFLSYGGRCDDLAFDIVVHARSETKYGQENRNWPMDSWKHFVKYVRRVNPDAKICCIGTTAHHVPGTVDYTGANLEVLCDILHSSKVLVGPSSGPMHLGELCRIPRIVWTDRKPQTILDGRANRERYERIWRPYKTPVTVVDEYGWQPPAERIAEMALGAIE